MFSESADVYDAIYGTFKDYAAEAARVADLVRAEHPAAHTILDVACGTGEHVRYLRDRHGFAVDGLDLDGGLLNIARQKVPDAQFFQADMSEFELDRRYDVVLCLFSSIGYLRSLERITAALRCFRRHLAEGGMIVVEPWFAPGVLQDGYTSTTSGEANGVRVERASRTRVDWRSSKLFFDYRIEAASGVRLVHEVHELGLFTPPEMLDAFRAASLAATYDPTGLTARGLYVAREGGGP